VADKGNYAVVSVSSSKKNKQSGKYDTDFSSKYVRFVGDAYNCRPQKGQRIKIVDCGVSNVYMENGEKVYMKNPNYCVFKYVLQEDSNGNTTSEPMRLEPIDESQLPF
jgi:hypothetical protein